MIFYITNYVKYIDIVDWMFGCEVYIRQTWDTSNVINIKDLRLRAKHDFYKINDADLNAVIKKCIRNTFGISNNNGNFIGIMFKTSDYDESDGFVVDDVFVDLR